ncbi:hypothetical protein D3C71_1762740 [compost metagenome]
MRWLRPSEKEQLISFLKAIKTKTINFEKVRSRFSLEKSHTQGSVKYTFTENSDVITLHTKIQLSIEMPRHWDENNAWIALIQVLDPSSIPYSTRGNLTE